jgi:hypothetical protein
VIFDKKDRKLPYLGSMRKAVLITLLLFTFAKNEGGVKSISDVPPSFLIGSFVDDYKIRYTINDTLWVQQPHTKFHIIKWNTAKQYLIARNDAKNPGDGNQYTRIDYMTFKNMEPWRWGYCLTAYDAATDAIAEATAAADRENPTIGCGGFPFSRMRVSN